jgi:hypothetical protein
VSTGKAAVDAEVLLPSASACYFLGPHEKVEDEEDEHLYYTMGWTRELWIKSLGMPAVIPPPEEEKDLKTAIRATRAKAARSEMPRAKRLHRVLGFVSHVFPDERSTRG